MCIFMSFLKSVFHWNYLLFCGLIWDLLILDAKVWCINERNFQLCMFNLSLACYKFIIVNYSDCFPFVCLRNGERVIAVRKKFLLKFCALSAGSWGDNEFTRSQILQAGGTVLWNRPKERGNLKSKMGGRWKKLFYPFLA